MSRAAPAIDQDSSERRLVGIFDLEFFEGIFRLQLMAGLFCVARGGTTRYDFSLKQSVLHGAPTTALRVPFRLGIGDPGGGLHAGVVL